MSKFPSWFTDQSLPRVERFGDIHAGEVAVEDAPKPKITFKEQRALDAERKAVRLAIQRIESKGNRERKAKFTVEQRASMRERLSKNLQIQRERDSK